MSYGEISPSVYGIENEYSGMVRLPGNVVYELVGSCHSQDARIGLYQQPPKQGFSKITTEQFNAAFESLDIFRTPSGMLSNGARFYLDPSGPEYDTAEASTAEEAVRLSFDGDTILLKVFDYLRQHEIIEGFQFNRRTVDHNRASRGIHINTLTSLPADSDTIINIWEYIAALNVAKGAIFGSGGLLINKYGETEFHHSPRLSVTSHPLAHYNLYWQRPLVRYPFKPDGAQLARVETVTSDALNFGWPIRASMVASNALMKLLEMGYGPHLPKLWRPELAGRIVGQFGNERFIAAQNRDGDPVKVKPLEVLRFICEVVLEVNDRQQHLDKESTQVIPEIIDVIDRMDEDPFLAANQVESVTRETAMDKKMSQQDVTLDSERMCRFDYAWDWLGGGVAETLRDKGVGWQGFSTADTSVKKRLVQPPQDTRAKIRGDRIKETRGNNQSTWSMLDDGSVKLEYVHPLVSQLP